MSNPLNVGMRQQQQQPDLNALFEQFKQNPNKYLNLPSNITTPQQALQYYYTMGKVPPMLRDRVAAMLGTK